MEKVKLTNQVRGVLWNTLGSAMWGLNSFVMLAAVSRFTSVEETGSFGIAFTTAQILYLVGVFGMSHYQMTDYEEKYSFRAYGRLRGFSCLLALACCAAAIFGLRFTQEKAAYTVALTVLMLLNAVGDLYQSLFFQKNRLDLSGSALFYRTLWSLAAFCVVLAITRSITFAVLMQILVNLLLTLYYVKKVAPLFAAERRETQETSVVELLWECVPLFGSLLLMNIVISASKYGVELLLDDTAQGYYNMLFMPAQVINLCSQFLFKPFLNRYAQLLNEKRNADFFRLLSRQIGWVTALTGACCAAAWFLGTPVLGFLYGQDLSGFSVPLTLIVLGGGIFALCQLLYYVLVILRRQRTILLIYGVGVVITLAVTWLLVGRYALTGAALAFIGAHVVILLAYVSALTWQLRRG